MFVIDLYFSWKDSARDFVAELRNVSSTGMLSMRYFLLPSYTTENRSRESQLRAYQLLLILLPCIGTSQSDFMIPSTLSFLQTSETLQLVEALNETVSNMHSINLLIKFTHKFITHVACPISVY